ncbi:hypothetical protein CDD81_2580 [Ophiocordyceps australis]|uniref:Fatty acid hydroxylase domain-containing protein n=1 Tax=Ophiocordyceps australis TaxID=1399860 RepID=A0A2C5XWH8_9HYPO|nr:hypothetical protein CDD81_2580 [Ophiocordyceps australis]
MADKQPVAPGPCPRPPLIPGISDQALSLVVPVATHWLTSAFYEVIQQFGFFEKYRIHSSREEDEKNIVGRLECLRGVLTVQILQTALGVVIGALSEVEVTGAQDADLLAWEGRVQDVGKVIHTLVSACGLDVQLLCQAQVQRLVSKVIYHGLIPALRFYVALWLADTWVFFIHRAEHCNTWIYKKFHAHHHELHVPYSWGGIYDHPLENLFLSVGAFALAVIGTGMTLRESIFFSAFSSIKTCTDHGGYRFPWNPIDVLTTVDADYHDKHHQRWGLKTNFALHFQFWDRLLGTDFSDTQAAARLYARDRKAAEMGADNKTRKMKVS